jgi:hypothetical protein
MKKYKCCRCGMTKTVKRLKGNSVYMTGNIRLKLIWDYLNNKYAYMCFECFHKDILGKPYYPRQRLHEK